METDAQYHAKSKSGEYLSYHMLKKFVECPKVYHDIINGNGPKDSDSKAFAFGRAAHKLILEGFEAFTECYTCNAPVNPSTGKPYGVGTKKFEAWRETEHREYVNYDDFDRLIAMGKAVETHPIAANLLTGGDPEFILRGTYCGIKCQARADYLQWGENETALIDLKTTSDMRWFEHDAKRFGYIEQLAFYREMVRVGCEMTADWPVDVALVAVESVYPHRVGVWKISQTALDEARVDNEAAMKHFIQCRNNDTWETGYEVMRVM